MLRFLRHLMPKEEAFVEYFTEHAQRMVEASDALLAMMEAPLEERQERIKEVCEIEGQADEVTKKTIVALHKAFITPFDRSDIHALITAMDDAVDLVEEVAQHSTLYDVKEFSPGMKELAGKIREGSRLLLEAMPLLCDISGNAAKINVICEKIGKIESEADGILRVALRELIQEKPDPITFLGRKEVYELLESATDRCDDVGNVIAGIVFDHV